jgi:hypothetical protein
MLTQSRRDRILEKVAQNQFGQPGGYSAEAAYAKGSPIASALSSAGGAAKSFAKNLVTRGYEDRKLSEGVMRNYMGPGGPLPRTAPAAVPRAPGQRGSQFETAEGPGM